MSSTYSNLKFELIGTGEQNGSWGATTNSNIGTAIEQAIVGMATLDAGKFTANVATLSLANTPAAQDARALCLNITAGAVSAAGTVNVPAIQKPYIVINDSSFAVTVKVSGLTGVIVPAGKRTVVYNNGTDVGAQVTHLPNLTLATALAIADGGTGASTAAGARTSLGLGTMATQAASAVAITGGSITGITDLAIADGGTGASTAGDARTNLGLGTMATQASSSVSITGGSITGITDLAVADGGTGASTAGDARTNLGLGTMATQASSSVSITGGSITGITDLAIADGGTGASTAADARTNLGLGTMATQASSSVSITGGSITGITDLAVADGGTGASDASGARTNLGLGTMATQAANNVAITGGSATGLTSLGVTGFTETVFAITDGASVDINPVNGTIQTWTLGASRTPTATSFANGQSITLMVVAGAYTVTWTSIPVTWVGGSAPTLATGTNKNFIVLWKIGGTVYGLSVGSAV